MKNLSALLSGASLGDLTSLEGLVRYLHENLKSDNRSRLKKNKINRKCVPKYCMSIPHLHAFRIIHVHFDENVY